MNPLSDALGGGGYDAMRFGRMPPGPTDALGGAGPTVFPPNGMTRPAPASPDPQFLQLLLMLLQRLGLGQGQGQGAAPGMGMGGPRTPSAPMPGLQGFAEAGQAAPWLQGR